ncbi:heavy-metal-associated domain-containing protein [Chlorobium limicola]|uniref:Heavy metal transporter n=1 Tax=Chlorobium limicola TaxID=1092 RepID=A0A124G793_CHLLI|nr:heavy-metal-associated domain-containing protein [Chlorobium limicola]KUL21955.1 heavy metal transporter [Chlorobium limicola]
MQKEFAVTGMRCSSCENLVKEALEELYGVEEVRVSHSEGVVAVSYEPSLVSTAAMIAVIEEQGFKVVS